VGEQRGNAGVERGCDWAAGGCGLYLQHDIALHVALAAAASVLVRPLEMQERTLVVVHLALARARRICVVVVVRVGAHWIAVVADLIAAVRIILGVVEARLILRGVGHLVQLVIRTAGRKKEKGDSALAVLR
jgi:hypothetical protein